MASHRPEPKRRRFTPLALTAGIVGSLLLAVTLTGSLSAFTASINDSVNTVTSGKLAMQESLGATTCNSTDSATNAATCATINKYGGQTLLPGGATTTTVTVTNTGNVTPATFTLTPGTCSQTGAAPTGITTLTDFCAQVTLKAYAAATATGTPIYNGTLAAFTAALTLTPLAGAAAQAYTFVVSLPAGLANGYQGLTAQQTLLWAFSS